MSNCKGGWLTGPLLVVVTQASIVWAEHHWLKMGAIPFSKLQRSLVMMVAKSWLIGNYRARFAAPITLLLGCNRQMAVGKC